VNTPAWLFFALAFWIGATLWCNSLEPAKTELYPETVAQTIEGENSIRDTSVLTPSVSTATRWAGNVWKALSFDYVVFDNDNTVMQILHALCIIFTIASLWFIADLIIMVWRVFHAVRGAF
jgi:hypothetical protein